jgi:putative flippase GtrA
VTISPVIMRLVRSGGAGSLATVADMGSLWVMVSCFGVGAIPARVPALVFGSIVMFLGNKYFVFQHRSAHNLARETILFAVVQAIGIALTNWLFRTLLGLHASFAQHYVLVGLVANNLTWLGYFFPMWHFVFKVQETKLTVEPSVVAQTSPPQIDREELDPRTG